MNIKYEIEDMHGRPVLSRPLTEYETECQEVCGDLGSPLNSEYLNYLPENPNQNPGFTAEFAI